MKNTIKKGVLDFLNLKFNVKYGTIWGGKNEPQGLHIKHSLIFFLRYRISFSIFLPEKKYKISQDFQMNKISGKILVTGADGFIGSHLVEALIREGCDVRAMVLYNPFNARQYKRKPSYPIFPENLVSWQPYTQINTILIRTLTL